MTSVLSATRSRCRTLTSATGNALLCDDFLRRATVLVSQAYAALSDGCVDDALDFAYQAALRTAGARCAGSAVIAARKRLPASAWEKLSLIDEEGTARATQFRHWSAVWERMHLGLHHSVTAQQVRELLWQVETFIDDVAQEANSLRQAA